jgi:GAF domain-containing protein
MLLLDVSACRLVALQPAVTVVPDRTQEPRFANNSLANAVDGGLRFYDGVLLKMPEGLPLGMVYVLNTKPRPEGGRERQSRALCILPHQTMLQLELFSTPNRRRPPKPCRPDAKPETSAPFSARPPEGPSEIGPRRSLPAR